jgi:ABC-type uncharacterized transport system substrate-binding protein
MAKALYSFALIFILAQPALAHPHIFAKYEVEIGQKSDAAYALHFTFKVRNVAPANPLLRNQPYVADNLLEAIARHPFYIFVDIDGYSVGQRNVDLAPVAKSDDELTYVFDMDIPATAQDFGFSIYDPEYYGAVSLAGAGALKVQIARLNCWSSHEDVGETMWGTNSATHVECGDINRPPRRVAPSKNIGEPNAGWPSGNQSLPP